MQPSLYDFSPALRLVITGLLLASGPLLMVYLRNLRAQPLARMHALTVVTLFLTFDLVLFGAFTRLTDSGLGCPDWPGCYGHASPLGASVDIASAQRALPTGPVTSGKAWVEMVHRYLAMAVGVLITVLMVVAWLQRRQRSTMASPRPWWATATFVWVCVQGAFGALTVTMKLFPAIVTLHLLGSYLLLALLTVMAGHLEQHRELSAPIAVPGSVRWYGVFALATLLLQAASGAWVSTNYAVLACTDFPACQGSWWPLMDFAQGFEFWRPLGVTAGGSNISFQALTAVHFVHRCLAVMALCVLGGFTVAISRVPSLRKLSRMLGGLLAVQALTGISNVVLVWPLLGAVLHTGGAGAMVVALVWMLVRTRTSLRAPATRGLRP